jgi:hypothetical protein
MDNKIAHFGFSQFGNKEIKRNIYDETKYKPYISEDDNGQIRISLFHDMFHDPNRKMFNNQIQIKTTELNVLWDIKPYKNNPMATGFRASLYGDINDNVWSPPENEPMKSRTMFMSDILNDYQNDIIPRIIANLGNYEKVKDDDKKKVFKALKLKAKDGNSLLEEIRSKISPSIKQGEYEDKFYNPDFRLKLSTRKDKDNNEVKYKLELYSEKGSEIMSIHENIENIENELPRGSKFMAIIAPSLWIKDSMINILWQVSEIGIISRPEKAKVGPKNSSFADDIESYKNCEEDTMNKVDEKMANNTIADSSDDNNDNDNDNDDDNDDDDDDDDDEEDEE